MKARPENDRNYVADDHFRELRFNLLHSCSWITNSMRQFLQPHDITPKQYSILRLLNERFPESLSIQELRDMLADKMSDASRLVDRLEKKNFLSKFPSDHDRRSNRTRITNQGRELVTRINRERTQLDALIGERLSDNEVDTLNDLLERLR